MQSGWCIDVAHFIVLGWYSYSEMKVNVVPYGTWGATAKLYVNNALVDETPVHYSKFFEDPPTLPGDGYCVDYPFDFGMDDWTCNESPIVIATGNSNAYKFTKKADGVLFDIDADGVLDQVSWTEPDSDVAFLAIDRNGNGTIDNGSELFGNNTLAGSNNGFAALRNMPGENGDGKVDVNDSLFANLLLWHDRNHNGISEPFELTPAGDLLQAIGLGYTKANRKDGNGNEYRLEGWARKPEPGKRGTDERGAKADKTDAAREFHIYDVWLVK